MPVTKVKLEKDERIGIRVLSKEKFAIELLAKKKGKSVTSIIKDAVDRVLRDPESNLTTVTADGKTVYLPDQCWHPILSERVVNMGLYAPELMSDYHLIIWKLIREEPDYWSGHEQPDRKLINDNWKKIEFAAMKILADIQNNPE